ncbi:MAG: MGH1-like glycoside hydrolase domain-containing protein [Phycisphaerales bacterium]
MPSPASPPPPAASLDAESARLEADRTRRENWKRWGPYLAERQWGTVREDYSPDGDCWHYLPHDHARSRAYRWGEDGLLGWTDRECRLCFALALWNGNDPILKERLFGLTGPEGNCGEDVKEQYFYLDSTPTHSYAKALYKYPHAAFPYDELVAAAKGRPREQGEFELADTGIFAESRYFDVLAEYAKASPDDTCIRLTITNRGPEAHTIHVLPTLWFRNTWNWGHTHEGWDETPGLKRLDPARVLADHPTLGKFVWHAEPGPTAASGPTLLFTENDTNSERLFKEPSPTPFTKDAFHRFVISGEQRAVNPAAVGTKAAAHYKLDLQAGESVTLRLRLAPQGAALPPFDSVFTSRIAEADAFFHATAPKSMPDGRRAIARQAYAGLMWSKQFYYYVVADWLKGDPGQPPPPPKRLNGRNRHWKHLFNRDVISMPDKWEYPWYAAWDLAFHCIAIAQIDPQFAKDQLLLLLREWYMHPSGTLPAYEFAFGDVNPPVHAWACWRVYKITAPPGQRDIGFLERAFQKLLINFTWWINRKDPEGNNVFGGGFLGLDNIGVFDRSMPMPPGITLNQADGTAWVAGYCGTMLSMALELALHNPAYEDIASKFFEHFIAIAEAINAFGENGLWDDEDGFYYDQLRKGDEAMRLRVRSLVGIIPLLAVEALPQATIDKLPEFRKRMEWFLRNREEVAQYTSCLIRLDRPGQGHRLLAIPTEERLKRVLSYVLDEEEFLSPHGVRSLSKYHLANPFVFESKALTSQVAYTPGESTTGMFGGNSNWRGPVWMPLNYILIEALERYHRFYGDALRIECPTGSGNQLTLAQVASHLRERLCKLVLPDDQGRRACLAGDKLFFPNGDDRPEPSLADLHLFHEYFHGDTGRGLGASHQTGWTALIAPLLADPYWLIDKAAANHKG